jgi:hypothetical protein
VRGLQLEGIGVAGEDGRRSAEAQFLVGPGKGLKQPAAEETGAAGDEEALAAQLVPELSCMSEYVI